MSRKQSPTKVSKQRHCLFCYKLVHHDGQKDSKAVVVEKQNLCSKFYSHLASSDVKPVAEKVKEKEDFEEVLASKCGICDDCFYVMEKQVKLFQELDRIKLSLQWQLEQFHGVIKCAGRVSPRLESFRQSFEQDEGLYEKAIKLRRNVFKYCTEKLQVPKPVIMMPPREPREDRPASQGTSNPVDDRSSNDENDDTTKNISNSPSDNILYVIKCEETFSEEDENSGRIVTPPESILETLRTGDCPLEGVSANHYFYVEPVPDPPCSVDGPTKPKNYKCIKCPATFEQELELIGHVQTGKCFAQDGISLKVTGRTVKKPKASKRKRAEDDNVIPAAKKSCQGNLNPAKSTLETLAEVRRIANGEDSDSSLSCSSHEDEEMSKPSSPRKTSPKKDLVKIKCPEDSCSKFFILKADLDMHMKQHDKFVCKFCEYRTNSVSSLVRHEVKTHSKRNIGGERVCPRCPITKVLSAKQRQQTSHYRHRHLTLT